MISTREWFRNAFDDLYLSLYGHRDGDEARRVIRWMAGPLDLDGATVLDLACGAARFQEPVLGRGARDYVGLDLSRSLLRVAAAREPRPMLVRGDMRALPFRASCRDVVLSMFTSLGYFATDDENRAVIADVARVLVPGGRFVADLLNPPHLRRTLVPEGEREVSGYRVHEARELQGERVVKTITVRDAGGVVIRTYEESVRLLDVPTLRRWADDVGLRLRARFGDYEGGAFDPDTSPRALLLFDKEAS